MTIMDEFWSRLGTDDGGMPIHLPIGFTPAGEGPTSDADAHHFACWCGNEQCPLTRALALVHDTEFTRAYEDVISRCRRDGNTKMALADLRAKVEGLPVVLVDLDPDPHGKPIVRQAVLRSDVLALFPEEKP